jgi:hypothetical protein
MAASLVLESRSGITGDVSTVAPIRFDVNLRLLAARQLTPFSVQHREVSIPTFGPGYLPGFVTILPRTGHTLLITVVSSGIHHQDPGALSWSRRFWREQGGMFVFPDQVFHRPEPLEKPDRFSER